MEKVDAGTRWSFNKEYKKIVLVKCPECKIYVEPDVGERCPLCTLTKLEDVTDRIEGYINRDQSW